LSQDLFEEALPQAEAAVTLSPDNPDAKRLYAELLASLKQWDKVAVAEDARTDTLRSNPRLMVMRAKSLGPEGSLEMCTQQLSENPAHTNAKFLKALALAALDRTAEAKTLVALDRLMEVGDLPFPAGFANADAFRDALQREIRANPTLASDPRGKATQDGLQTRQLRQPGSAAIEALLGEVRKAVDAYVERLDRSHDEFALGRPAKARLNAWAVIYGGNGRQKSHRHPNGWISGVYYVAAPRLAGENAYRGPLIVGTLDPVEHGIAPPWGTREVEPVPGRLVLFPSYFPHATEPTGIDGARISVAFDVVPVS
jgi:uncharacterized protein (TIGR02466 family)